MRWTHGVKKLEYELIDKNEMKKSQFHMETI